MGGRILRTLKALTLPVLAGLAIVSVTGWLSQFPLAIVNLGYAANWGQAVYPLLFLVLSLVGHVSGRRRALEAALLLFVLPILFVVLAGYVLEDLAGPIYTVNRVTLARVAAYVAALIIAVMAHDRLGDLGVWKAALGASFLALIVDSVLYFGIAYGGTGLPWALDAGYALVPGAAALLLALPLYLLLSRLLGAAAGPSFTADERRGEASAAAG